MYPYAVNFLGEVAFQADIIYKIPKKTAIGGKYGTSININFATAYAPNRTYLNDMDSSRKSYTQHLLMLVIVLLLKISILR